MKVKLPLLRKRFIEVDQSQIVYFESFNSIAKCHILSDTDVLDKVIINSTLNKLEEVIDQEQFVRIHRSYLVNLNCIDPYGEYPKEFVFINKSEYQLPLSKRRKLDFHNAYLRFHKSCAPG